LGKRTEKEDSSLKVPPRLSSGLKSSIWRRKLVFWCFLHDKMEMQGANHTFHLSMSSVSQGFSVLCVEGIFAVVWYKWRERERTILEYFVAANSRSQTTFHRARPWRVRNAGKSYSPPKHQKPSPHQFETQVNIEHAFLQQD
jgi:hypothetical protein